MNRQRFYHPARFEAIRSGRLLPFSVPCRLVKDAATGIWSEGAWINTPRYRESV